MKPFLTAEWRHLAMVNYEVSPAVLEPLVPRGTELDAYNHRTFASLVGFLFQRTRVRGVSIPFHANFEEFNLRFYVRRKSEDGWRRGVVFVREIVPRFWVAGIARWIYNENYLALPMRHSLEPAGSVRHEWKYAGRWSSLAVQTVGEPSLPAPGSEEEFITEHYWGYARQRDGSTREYQVEHVPWRVWQVQQTRVDCDIAGLYGARFVPFLIGKPSSAFLAEGSPVKVYPGLTL